MISGLFITLILAVVVCTTVSSAAKEVPLYPFQDVTLPWEKRVDDLVGRLTLEEIVQFSVEDVHVPAPSCPRLGIKPYRMNSECLRGIVGQNTTAWPQSLGLAATFSREVIYNMSVAVATELRALYNDAVMRGDYGHHGLSCYSPVINIMRHPLWGRNQETYGEDPFLTSELTVEYVKGLQGEHPRYARATAGCKHFAVFAGPQDNTGTGCSFNAEVSERDFRMTFLPQFKKCLDAGAYHVMCSYFGINGVPACVNKYLLTDILRGEWNFTGYVISDDDAVEQIITSHKYIKDPVDAVAQCVRSGCNIELTDRKFIYYNMVTAIKQGKLTEAEVRANLKPVFYTRLRLGEFDPPAMNPYTNISSFVILSPEHRRLATSAAAQSFVLLKNSNNVLPMLKKLQHIAVVGPYAKDGDLFGDYSAAPDPRFIGTPLDGLRRMSAHTESAAGCDDARCLTYDPESIRKAVVGAEVVFVCLGTGVSVETEGRDRDTLDLPGQQLQLLMDAVYYASGVPVILLLFNAGPLDVTYAKYNPAVSAIVECFLPAMTAGDALFDVLATTGAVPAARLPATWPAYLQQVPDITNYTMEGQTYRYYGDAEPLYPFGYGLSYSQFQYESLSVSPQSVKAGNNVTATVTVRNKGPYNADEVVQLYMSWGSQVTIPVPRWTLVGFDRQRIEVNKSRTFTFVVSADSMAVWTDKWTIIPGTMTLYASGQQPNQRTSTGANVLSSSFSITSAPGTEDTDQTIRFKGQQEKEILKNNGIVNDDNGKVMQGG